MPAGLVTIVKKFEFEASHKLPDEPEYGACSRLHGHTYKLEVAVTGHIDKFGWVMNFKDLKAIVQREIIDKFDHRHLNDYIECPTAEILVRDFYLILRAALSAKVTLEFVRLYETSNSYVEVRA